MTASGPELTAEQITALLTELAERLRRRGVAPDLYIVGGAAIALTVASRRVTSDIDALLGDEAIALEVAAEIAHERGLPDDWINQSVRPFVPPRDRASETQVTPGVWLAPASHLLAMKLAAYRRVDVPDAHALVQHLGVTSEVELARMVRQVYGDMAETVMGVADLDAECRALWRDLRSTPPSG